MPLPSRMPAPDLTPLHVFYLHGFASSPQSTKVGYFSERLREHGVDVRCPDFNQPAFSTLTLRAQLIQHAPEPQRRKVRPREFLAAHVDAPPAPPSAGPVPLPPTPLRPRP